MKINERSMPEDNDDVFLSHFERYKFCLKYVKDKKVASMACGSGYGEYLMASKGEAKEVIGVDNSRQALEYAKNNFKASNLFFYKKDILDSKLNNFSVDVIVSLETIEHVKAPKILLGEFYRILKPGGKLIISTPNKAFSYRNLFSFRPINPYHFKEYRKKNFLKLLSKYFSNIELYGQEIIFKRSLFNLPKYFLYKLNGRLKNIEKGGFEIVVYPRNNDFEACQFLAVCTKYE